MADNIIAQVDDGRLSFDDALPSLLQISQNF